MLVSDAVLGCALEDLAIEANLLDKLVEPVLEVLIQAGQFWTSVSRDADSALLALVAVVLVVLDECG